MLIVGGFESFSQIIRSALLYDETTERLESAGLLVHARALHSATLLPSGRVLVAGGKGENGYLASAEIFDPATLSWTEVASPAIRRGEHTATLTESGKVVLAGGYDDSLPSIRDQTLRAVEVYDPMSDVWMTVDAMAMKRRQHTASLLPDGRVLVVGGRNDDFGTVELDSVELFEPASMTWSSGESLGFGRTGHTTVLHPSGLVVIGGNPPGAVVEMTEVQGGQWSSTDPSQGAFSRHTAMVMSDGKVMAIGFPGVELYDPENESWTTLPSPDLSRINHTATLLRSGEVLVAGGTTYDEGTAIYHDLVDIYDPISNEWRAAHPMSTRREGHAAVLLSDGRALVAGGNYRNGNGALSSAEIYDSDGDSWSSIGNMSAKRYRPVAILLGDGRVMVLGGSGISGTLDTTEIYDPISAAWQQTAPPIRAIHSHFTATVLPSGKVLVAGGNSGEALASTQLYDPRTDTWTESGPLNFARETHVATLLPSGKVVVAGGLGADGTYLSSVELYDPNTGQWSLMAPLAEPRRHHAAAPLRHNGFLVVGGHTSCCTITQNAEIFQSSFSPGRAPQIVQAPQEIFYGRELDLEIVVPIELEASGGNTHQSSAVSQPIVSMIPVDGSRQAWLSATTESRAADGVHSLRIRTIPPIFHPGPHLITVFSSGTPSAPVVVDLQCSLEIDEQPSDQVVSPGGRATFRVATQGGRRFQWHKDGEPIEGADENTYVTPPVTPDDSGTTYSVTASSGCMTQKSSVATLTVFDVDAPRANVSSPGDGAFWLLSDPAPSEPNSEVVSWQMSDNIRICRVEAHLLYSDDGVTFQPISEDGGLLHSEGPGGTCRFDEEPTTTSIHYSIPVEPPSGRAGSLYQVRVSVVDHVGLETVATNTHPFFFVRSDPSAVRTAILHNVSRMLEASVMGAPISDEEAGALGINLEDLANHPRVQGQLIDLAHADLPYGTWDADPADPAAANAIVLAIRDYLREEVLAVFTGIEHIVLVGDDRIIPMARIDDRTGFLESEYTAGPDLRPDGSTVGQAIVADQYLTDDLLAVRGPVELPLSKAVLLRGAFLPDLTIGRLVETPSEIIGTIATFISQDGVLDLETL
ncbi:MAG: hypothetical protein MI919_42305, partial [Holophagales bacterium]|nr:hypothetical protein [Holophagales bacterium]